MAIASIERLEQEVALYWHQSFEVTRRMKVSRLQKLFESAVRREKKTPDPEPISVDARDAKNRQALIALLTSQEDQQERNKSKKTRYKKV